MTIPATDGLTTLLRPQAKPLLAAEPQVSSATQADAKAPATTADGSVDRVEDTYEKAPRGLMRKLEEGGFNPIADLRHRIKHHAEIEARGLELPELGEPKGNGRAYQKFLKAYELLQGPTADNSPDQKGPDAVEPTPRAPTTPTTPTSQPIPVAPASMMPPIQPIDLVA